MERPVEETAEDAVDESAEAQTEQVITTRTLPARLLAGYSEDALAADHDMGLGVVFRSLLPCVLLASLLFWWLVGQLLEQIRAVKSYAERLSGGDLSESLDLKNASDVRVLPKRSIPSAQFYVRNLKCAHGIGRLTVARRASKSPQIRSPKKPSISPMPSRRSRVST